MIQIQKKPRNSNLELYRIDHYVVNSVMAEEMAKEPLSSRSLFLHLWNVGKDWY